MLDAAVKLATTSVDAGKTRAAQEGVRSFLALEDERIMVVWRVEMLCS